MIAKHIKPLKKTEKEAKKRPYSYKNLGIYISSAPEDCEKLDNFWIVNSKGGESLEDLDLALIDIENIQKMNTKVKKEEKKTYHLMVSFRNEKPDLETLKDIEQEFAKTLGFEEHQRVVGTHINTDNFHMHVAYNKIHPKTLRSHSPFRDYIALSKVCREMEKKYNLQVDNGFEKTREKGYKKPHLKAKDFEAKTWQQSFYSYVTEKKEDFLTALEQAEKWQDLHDAFEEQGLLLKKRGNGLSIVSIEDNVAIKASDLDRKFSKNSLQKKLGSFEPSQRTQKIKNRYEEKPLVKHKHTEKLWKKYKAEIKSPKLRNKKKSLLKKAFYHWKDFLMYEALHDPLAMAIIIAQKKLINALFLQHSNNKNLKQPFKDLDKNQKIKRQEKILKERLTEILNGKVKQLEKDDINLLRKEIDKLSKQIKRFTDEGLQGDWASKKKALLQNILENYQIGATEIKPKERIYLSKAFKEKEELKQLGAKWDKQQKSWYIERSEDINETITKIDIITSLGVEVSVPLDIAEEMGADISQAPKPEVTKKQSKEKTINKENQKSKDKDVSL